MQLSQDAQVLDAVVRMVVPMRREFGFSVDVQAFMRDAAYAQQVLGQALTSQVQRLRQYAEIAQLRVRPAPTDAPIAEPAVATDRTAAAAAAAARADPFPAFPAQRRQAVQQLLQLVGPVVEPLCIKMEKARTPDELATLLKLAVKVVANQRGSHAAHDYIAAIGLDEQAAS